MKKNLELSELKEKLHYNPKTGHFTRIQSWHQRYVGKRAGTICKNGYEQILIGKRAFKGHHLAWFYTYGVWPKQDIDHKNGNCSDNRIENLREATKSENMYNRHINKNNTTGVKGVSRHGNKLRCNVQANGVRRYLGLFETLKEAAEARAAVVNDLHGRFARAA